MTRRTGSVCPRRRRAPSTNKPIRSRTPLLNSTGVFDLRNSDCDCSCMAPMSLTARWSGLNRPRGALRPLGRANCGPRCRGSPRLCACPERRRRAPFRCRDTYLASPARQCDPARLRMPRATNGTRDSRAQSRRARPLRRVPAPSRNALRHVAGRRARNIPEVNRSAHWERRWRTPAYRAFP